MSQARFTAILTPLVYATLAVDAVMQADQSFDLGHPIAASLTALSALAWCMLVDCPICEARPGRPCVNQGKPRTWVHWRRKLEAKVVGVIRGRRLDLRHAAWLKERILRGAT